MITKDRRVSKNIEDTRPSKKGDKPKKKESLVGKKVEVNQKLIEKTPIDKQRRDWFEEFVDGRKVTDSNKFKNLKETKEPQHLIPISKKK